MSKPQYKYSKHASDLLRKFAQHPNVLSIEQRGGKCVITWRF